MNNQQPAHASFEPVRTAHIQSLDIDVQEYRHRVLGTPHFHLAADNPENVFLVGLRTVPTDSTGVAHILEHTVLCGSQKYPVRDPFFMMIRRSLNTFMNAFTSTDWTAYPFASQNRKDFHNLLDVYLDAVFFSNLHELDFAQEGHRVEFETASDPSTDLVFKGVVFNEMKGAMSSATSTLWQTLSKYLYPDTTYHYNSGGDPEAIPDLSHAQLKAFYDTHYHPSNAIFMTFGDIPAAEVQAKFDGQVMRRFEPLERNISVRPASRYHSPIRVEEAYATQDEDTDDKTHIVLGWLLGESVDLDQRLRAHLLSSVLLDNSASPLLQALEQSELGSSPSPLCGMDDSNLEMVFVAGLEGSRAECSEATEKLVLDVLEEVAANGVGAEQVEAVLHQLELSQREIRGDGMPFGLQLVLSGLGTAVQRGDTVAAIDLDPALERLRREATQPGFMEGLVREWLLDNPHRVRLTLRPDTRISARRNEAEKSRLQRMRSALDEANRDAIVARAAALSKRQAQQDDPDILPKVTREDVPADLRIPEPANTRIAAAPALVYAQGTNGLVYQHVAVQLPELGDVLRPLLPLYLTCLSETGSGGRDYLATQRRQAEVTGGIAAYTLQRGTIDSEQDVSGYLVLRGKALLRNSEALAGLLFETLDSARFDEQARVRELIAQLRAGREQSVTGSGHMLAMLAASSGMSPTSRLGHQLNGLAGIRALKTLDDTLDDPAELSALCDRLAELHQLMRQAPRQYMVVSEAEHDTSVASHMNTAFQGLPSATSGNAWTTSPVRESVAQLWTTSTEVNFCAAAYPTVAPAHPDAAALAVLGPFLRNGFLHRTIRETGGAYGGGAMQDGDSASFRFFSYRDPRLVDTLADFNASIEWLASHRHESQNLDEAVLNVISSIDKPGSPAGEARGAWHSGLFGRSPEWRRYFRQQILQVTLEDLQRVGAQYLVDSNRSIGVVSNETIASTGDVEGLALAPVKG